MKCRLAMILLIAALLVLTGWAQAVDKPVHEVIKTTAAPVIDGKVDDEVWGKAEELLFYDNFTGSPDKLGTWAKLAYDDEYLYFAFSVTDENIWSTFKNRDEHLWTEEVVEVFIQADQKHPNYIELEVNPLGTMLDIYLIDIRKPIKYESWNSARMQWAVQIDGTVDGEPGDRSWTCEIALPHEDVVTAANIPPKPGDRWGMNLYRVESRPDSAGLAWSPTRKRDFHVPSMFGTIVFK